MSNTASGRSKHFVVAGLPRSGTTFLYHNLKKHPHIFLPYRKEVEYFSMRYHRGLDWYLEFYEDIRPDQVAGDVSPNYVMCPQAVERLKQFDNEVKIILAVRDPAETILSMYAQYGTLYRDLPPLEQFLKSYTVKKGSDHLELRLSQYTFFDVVQEYRSAFGHNLLLYNYELFKTDPLIILQAIEAFVGAGSYFSEHNFDNVVINSVRRRNIKLVNRLLAHEGLIAALGRLCPRRLIQSVRGSFDRLGKQRCAYTPPCYTEENRQLVQAAFADDCAAVREMFADQGMILGSGTPFLPCMQTVQV